MTARIDRNMLLKLLALEGQGSDAYLVEQLEARIDEWLVESTAPAPVEPVLDLDALERAILASAPGLGGIADRIAAAVERHVAPILAARKRATQAAPETPEQQAKRDAEALRRVAELRRASGFPILAHTLDLLARHLDPPKPPEPEPGQRLYELFAAEAGSHTTWVELSADKRGRYNRAVERYEASRTIQREPRVIRDGDPEPEVGPTVWVSRDDEWRHEPDGWRYGGDFRRWLWDALAPYLPLTERVDP